MPDLPVEIPNRAAFKASEVCELAQIPSYVLRSWEKEFPKLGAAARPGGPRIYRRADIEQILRIKHFVFVEGLTLAGARHRLEGEPPAEEDELLKAPPALADELRGRVATVRRELKSLLEMLSGPDRATSAGQPQHTKADGTAERAGSAASPAEDLPLIDGVPDTPPKPHRGRRRSGS